MNIGILGSGNIARTMAHTLAQMEDAQLYAVAARDRARAEQRAREWGAQKAYGSYRELAEDPAVELIYVATPHSEHFANTLLCLESGKPVLCEKPFTANREQAAALFAKAEAAGLFLSEAMWTRFLPFLGTIRRVLDAGAIGRPEVLTANLGGAMEHIPRMREPALAGGALLDVGFYALHFASMLFGDDIASVTSACTKTELGVDRHCGILLTWTDGRMAVLHSSMAAQTTGTGVIEGSAGYAIVRNIPNFETFHVYRNHAVAASYARPAQISGYEYEVRAAMAAIREGRTECPEIPHAQTLRILGWMDALRAEWGIRYPFE